MKPNGSPILDPRDASLVFSQLVARHPAYLPDRALSEGRPDSAMLRIFARYMEVVIERLNQAPDKNLLAFLDMLGLSLIPAQAARAPVVFEPLTLVGDSHIPAGMRLGAEGDQPGSIVFETERATAVAAARLVEVRTLWPQLDAYADHTEAFASSRPFTLFEPRRPVSHILYLAHSTLLDFNGETTVEIEVDLATPGSDSLAIIWEYYDGQTWRPFRPFDVADPHASKDGTAGLTRSGIVTLRAECGQSQPITISGIKANWLRGRLDQPLPPDPVRVLAEVDRIRLRSAIDRPVEFSLFRGIKADYAFADGLSLDVSKTFYPFGQVPLPGSTFYFTSEIFHKPGATMTVGIKLLQSANPVPDEVGIDSLLTPETVYEYWSRSQRWVPLAVENARPPDPQAEKDPIRFLGDGTYTMLIPADMAAIEINGREAFWMRARLTSGAYGFQRTIVFSTAAPPVVFTRVETIPPVIDDMRLGYSYRSPWERPEHCLTCNDFQFEIHSHDICWPGGFFPPFRAVADVSPALYLGFDRPLPNDLVSVYLDIQERDTAKQPLVWETWDSKGWREVSVTDETSGLRRPGLVSFIVPQITPRPQADIGQAGDNQIVVRDVLAAAVFQPGDRVVVRQEEAQETGIVQQIETAVIQLAAPLSDSYTGGTVSLAAFPRFGRPLDWLRARLKEPTAPVQSQFRGIYLNATWARQAQTVENELLGSGLGHPNQSLFFTQVPVLPGEQIEVRELEGARAKVELPILRETLLKQGLSEADIRVVSNTRTGQIEEVWVRWQARDQLFFSGPDDRHYQVERARGRVTFGDGQYGRLPTVGANNIQARRYRAGGGLAGNVPAGKITQLLGVAPFVQGVTNPRAAEGGAEAETIEAVKRRGPQKIRHRGRALAARDYEALALEATPGVAVARALSATAPNLRPAPGWVTVIIIPHSLAPQPQPTFELRRQVQSYLVERAPASLFAERIAVIGPTYLPVGVATKIVPRKPDQAGLIESRVRAALQAFLHPLGGGPDGRGWPFGRGVYQSDAAALLEAISGVDYVAELNLLLDGTPQDEWVPVPPDRIVVAGPLEIALKAA